MDAEELRENAHKMVDFIADYYKSIESYPVLSQVQVMFYLWGFQYIYHFVALFHFTVLPAMNCISSFNSVLVMWVC